MKNIVINAMLVLTLVLTSNALAQQAPHNFDAAKRVVGKVYEDNPVTFYCGCKANLRGRGTSGTIDYNDCSYVPENPGGVRESRIEAEHIVPISAVWSNQKCWKDGGRRNCQRSDQAFGFAEGDPRNLTLAIGSINQQRSNYKPKEGIFSSKDYGRCDLKINTGQRAIEPNDRAKGVMARVYFLMADEYPSYALPKSKQRLLMQWHQNNPPDAWEIEKNKRIHAATGLNNPYVTGEKRWTLKSEAEQMQGFASHMRSSSASERPAQPKSDEAQGRVKGNVNSKIYHLPGCGSYNRLSERNTKYFNSESEAQAAGYRKARNC